MILEGGDARGLLMGRLLLNERLILLWAVAMATAMIAKYACGAALCQPPSKRGYTWKPLLAAVWPSPRSR